MTIRVDIWIGLRYYPSESLWKWADGSEFDIKSNGLNKNIWINDLVPNASEDDVKHCVKADSKRKHKWELADCADKFVGICYSPPETTTSQRK